MTTTTPDATPIGTTTDAADREARFTTAVRSLRTKVTGAAIERWFRLAGPVLIPLGALMVLLAWWGAANTTRIYLQIPYLISGGILGLGFMFVGGFVYFARWLTDLLDAVRAQTQRAEDAERRSIEALERIESLLHSSAATPVVDPTLVESTVGAPATGEALVTTTHGKLVHLASCRLVAGRDTQPASASDMAASGVCRICQPDTVEA